jgi:KipI family sensor histidine kinase inhibitor
MLAVFGERIDPTTNRLVHNLAAALQEVRVREAPWLGSPVAAYASLLVPFDPEAVAVSRVEALVAEAADRLAGDAPARANDVLEIAVRYGGPEGPDLDEVAGALSLTPEEVVAMHAACDYIVYMLGFAPGFGYLGELPAQLELPRRATPRPRVAPGSVAIAGRQTAVYPLATPGGWHVIGRTDVPMWDPSRPDPALLRPGMAVRFVAA